MKAQFKIGLIFGDNPERPPEKIAPGYEFAEVPQALQLLPFQGANVWAAKREQLASWHLPPITVSSHFLEGIPRVRLTNVEGDDNELLEFWMKRSFARLAEVGVKVVGIGGGCFRVPEGLPHTKAMDGALRSAYLLGEQARAHDMVIALEPQANEDELWPRYLEGIAFAKELKHPNVKVMGDSAYFYKIPQPFEDCYQDPDYLVHFHIADDGGLQPGTGKRPLDRLFKILMDIGYQGGVSCACKWVGDFGEETAKSLRYLQALRAAAYKER